MSASSVPTSNLNALYTNTTGGTVADPSIMDAAVQDIVSTVNSNANDQNELVSTSLLSRLGVINVKDYGASGSAVTTTGNITSGSAVLVVASTTSFSVGQGISIAGAGASGATLVSIISSIVGTNVFLNDSASTTVAGAVIKHDETVALQAAIDYAVSVGKTEIIVPYGTYYYGVLTDTSGITFVGDGVTFTGTTAVTLTNLGAQLAETAAFEIQTDMNFENIKASKKLAFIEQFITGFYSRGQLASEAATENITTETSITIARSAGYGGVDIADTTHFKEGTILVIKYDDTTYSTHFITGVTSSIVLAIKPPLIQATTLSSKVERGWYNSAHAGKFYIRYLAQNLVDATEVNNGFGDYAFYANFDGDSNDDVGVAVSTATLGTNPSVNKSTTYGNVLESCIGKAAFFSTSTIGGGIKLPTFYAENSENLILKLFAMNREAGNTTKISVKYDSTEIASFTISGAASQIMKPYELEFTAPYNANLLYVEITNQTAVLNVVYFDEVRVLRNLQKNNSVLPSSGTILALGDSWVAGDLASTTNREPLTQHLATLLPDATILNKGVGGNKVQDLLARFDTDVTPFEPDVVIILTGVNDVYNPVSATFDPNSIDYYVGKMKELIQKCIDIGAKPVVIGVPALAEEDGAFTTFELNDRARLYNKRLYRELYEDDHGKPTVNLLSTNRYGKLDNNGTYVSGNNYKDLNITVDTTAIKLKKIRILAKAFNSSTTANVLVKVYDSTRTTVLATSDTLTIEADMALQMLEFTIPILTLAASTDYILAFEGTGLWSVHEGGSGTTKDYGLFTITNLISGNTTPPATTLNKWIGLVLVPVIGVQSIFVDNTPTRYTFLPSLTEVNSDGTINVLDDKDKLILSFHAKVGQEFEYEE